MAARAAKRVRKNLDGLTNAQVTKLNARLGGMAGTLDSKWSTICYAGIVNKQSYYRYAINNIFNYYTIMMEHNPDTGALELDKLSNLLRERLDSKEGRERLAALGSYSITSLKNNYLSSTFFGLSGAGISVDKGFIKAMMSAHFKSSAPQSLVNTIDWGRLVPGKLDSKTVTEIRKVTRNNNILVLPYAARAEWINLLTERIFTRCQFYITTSTIKRAIKESTFDPTNGMAKHKRNGLPREILVDPILFHSASFNLTKEGALDEVLENASLAGIADSILNFGSKNKTKG